MCLMNNVSLAGQNWIPYSSYNSTWWTASVADTQGTISMGTREEYRTRVNDDNTVTELNGVQTWEGTDLFVSGTFDMSTWTSFCFSVSFGAYQQCAGPIKNVAVVKDGTTSWQIYSNTITVPGSKRLVFAKTIQQLRDAALLVAGTLDLTTIVFHMVTDYVGTTADSMFYWWDDAQLEKDVTTPGVFLPTSGAAVSVATDTAIKSVMKVCKSCRYKFFHTYRGVIQREVQMPLDTDIEPLP
jgi:hypothetical protein